MPNPNKELTVEECPVESTLFSIKPLEWEWFEALTYRGYRSTAINKYVFNVTQMRGMPSEAWPEHWKVIVDSELVGRTSSPEEGKQLAEQHWQAYIRQALIEESQP